MKHSVLRVSLTILLLGSSVAFGGIEYKLTSKIRPKTDSTAAAGTTPTPAAPANTNALAAANAKLDALTDVDKAEKAVKYQLNVVKQTKARVVLANKNRDMLTAQSRGRTTTGAGAAAEQKRTDAANKMVTATEQQLTTAKAAFDILFDKYQKAGGTNDYRALLPQ